MLRKKIKVEDIAKFLSAEVFGNEKRIIHSPAHIDLAEEDNVAYCHFKTVEQEIQAIIKTKAGTIICSKELMKKLENSVFFKERDLTLIITENPKLAFSKVLQRFFIREFKGPSISPYAVIEEDAEIAEGVRIGAGCYIGHLVKIGRHSIIHPRVTIYDQSILGERVKIGSGTVIGAEGLEYARDNQDRYRDFPHISNVIIYNDVDIRSNTIIHRGVLQSTIIEEGTKIGSNVCIGHEVRIGKHCIIINGTVICGSVKIGNFTYISAGSTIINSVNIGDHVMIGMGTIILRDVPDNATFVGHPGEEFNIYKKRRKLLKNLQNILEKT